MVDIQKVPSWVVNFKEGENSTGASTGSPLNKTISQMGESENKSSHPFVVCVHEWIVEKSNPNSLIQRKNAALIRIELRRKPNQGLGLNGYRDLELGSESSDWSKVIQMGDVIVFHLLKKSVESIVSLDSNSSSSDVSSIGFSGVDDFRSTPPVVEDGSEWEGKLSVPLANVDLKLVKTKCLAEFDVGKHKKKILFHFPTMKESRHFLTFVNTLKSYLREIAMSAMKMERQKISTRESSEPVKFLVEIVSATDLKGEDNDMADPYVVVKFGRKKVHTTSVIRKNLNPIWTVDTGSMVIINLYPEELYVNDLMFEVRNKHTSSSLGQAILPTKKLIKFTGKRYEMKLKFLQLGKDAQGYLSVKCKRADASDIEFVENIKSNEFPTKEYYNNFVTPKLKARIKVKKRIGDIIYHLARPVQEDERKEWLTSTQIEDLANSQSLFWTEIGKKDEGLGKMYVEIIGLDGLSKDLDSTVIDPGKGTDAYVVCAFEDSAITSDVIQDCNSPRFLPWTRRAFKFNINDISSKLFIGAFDHDRGMHSNDPIGRISISLAKFVPNTTYNLSYELYDTGQISNRLSRGVIHLRLRMICKNERSLFFNSFKSQPARHAIHVDNSQNCEHIDYTIKGYTDVEEYDLKTVFSMVMEILSTYQAIFFTIRDTVKSIWLWRGQKKKIFCWEVYVPLHSIIMFTFAIIIAEHPQYTLSCFFASIAWMMLTILGGERKRPSRWSRPSPSYLSLLARLLTNHSRPETIEASTDDESESEPDSRQSVDMENEYEMKVRQFWLDYYQEFEEWNQNDAGSIHHYRTRNRNQNKKTRLSLFKDSLYPVQNILYTVVISKLRLVSSIMTWGDEMYISFWITTVAIICCIASIFITNEISLLMRRVVFYTLFGPWNKLFDLYFKKLDSLSSEKKKKLQRDRNQIKHDRGISLQAQLRKEKLEKEAAIKRQMFGDMVVQMPAKFMHEKYKAVPSMNSSAHPNTYDPEEDIENSFRRETMLGQRWVHIQHDFALSSHVCQLKYLYDTCSFR